MNGQRVSKSRIDQSVSFLMMLAIMMLGISVAAIIAFVLAVKIALSIWS